MNYLKLFEHCGTVLSESVLNCCNQKCIHRGLGVALGEPEFHFSHKSFWLVLGRMQQHVTLHREESSEHKMLALTHRPAAHGRLPVSCPAVKTDETTDVR